MVTRVSYTFARRTRRQCHQRSSMLAAQAFLGTIICLLLSEATSAFVLSPAAGHAAVPLSKQSLELTSPQSYGLELRPNVPVRAARASAATLSMIAKSGGKEIETTEAFDDLVLSPDLPRPALVFFSAPWCGPCRLSNPVVRDVMKQFSGKIDVVEVCTDDLPDVAAEAGVVSIPTIQIYFGGELLDTIVGCVAKNVLASAVTKILEDLGQDGEGIDGDDVE